MLIFSSLFITISYASAHTELVSSTPSVNEILTTTPDHVSLIFSEKLLVLPGKTTNTLEVTNSQGDILSSEHASIVGSELTTILDSQRMNEGRYSVKYRVVAEDGHTVKGSYEFSISKSASSTPTVLDKGLKTTDPNLGYFERNAKTFGLLLTITALVTSVIIYRKRKP